MAVALDNVASISGDAILSLTTASFDITSAANRAGALCFTMNTPSGTGFAGDIGATGGTLVTGTDQSSATNRSMVFGVTAPPSGSQTATFSWSSPNAKAVLGVVTASAVDQTTPFNNGTSATGTATPASLAITSTSGDLTVDTVGLEGPATTDISSPTQTQKWDLDLSGIYSGAGSTGPGTGTATHQWTVTTGGALTWVQSGANFVQAVLAVTIAGTATLIFSALVADTAGYLTQEV